MQNQLGISGLYLAQSNDYFQGISRLIVFIQYRIGGWWVQLVAIRGGKRPVRMSLWDSPNQTTAWGM